MSKELTNNKETFQGEIIIIQTVAGDIPCEQAIFGEWHVIEDKSLSIQYFGKTYKHCIEGVKKYYSGEIGQEPGDSYFVLFTESGLLQYNDTPIYMIVKHRDPNTGNVYLTQSRDFRLEFELLDENELEVVEKVHYSENTLDRALEIWSKKLGIPIIELSIKVSTPPRIHYTMN